MLKLFQLHSLHSKVTEEVNKPAGQVFATVSTWTLQTVDSKAALLLTAWLQFFSFLFPYLQCKKKRGNRVQRKWGRWVVKGVVQAWHFVLHSWGFVLLSVDYSQIRSAFSAVLSNWGHQETFLFLQLLSNWNGMAWPRGNYQASYSCSGNETYMIHILVKVE